MVAVLAVHLLALSVWVGNLVALPLIVGVVRELADDDLQAVFFPRMGRVFGTAGTVGLVVAILTGAVAAGSPGDWSAAATGALVTGVVLLVVTSAAMVQAVRVGRLRSALAAGSVTGPDAEAHLATQVRITDVGRIVIIVGTLVGLVLEASAIVG